MALEQVSYADLYHHLFSIPEVQHKVSSKNGHQCLKCKLHLFSSVKYIVVPC